MDKNEIDRLYAEYIETRSEIVYAKMYKLINTYIRKIASYFMIKNIDDIISTVHENIIVNIGVHDLSKRKLTTWIFDVVKHYSFEVYRQKKKRENEVSSDIDIEYVDADDEHTFYWSDDFDIYEELKLWCEDNPGNVKYVEAMIAFSGSRGAGKEYAKTIDNIKKQTLNTRAFNGRKSFKKWIDKKYGIINGIKSTGDIWWTSGDTGNS